MILRHCWRVTIGFIAVVVTGTALAANSDIVGEVDGKSITLADVEAREHDTLATNEARFQLELSRLNHKYSRSQQHVREAALSALIDEHVLDSEAKATHQKRQALLDGIVVRPVEDTEVLAFYESHRDSLNAPFETTKESIRTGLTKQAHEHAIHDYIDTLRAKYHALPKLEPLRDSVQARGPSRGPEHAAVTLIEFADFQCPYCARLAPVLTEIQARYPDQVRLVFRQLPIPQLHPDAERLSNASICADEQQHFWLFYDAVFQSPGRYSMESILRLIKTLGLDPMIFQACMDSDRPTQRVRADVADADALALEGTPALFLNGQLLSAPLSVNALTSLIDKELTSHSANSGASRLSSIH